MRKYLLIIPVLFLITSCEDVVEIDTPTEPPRLFVDAVIRVDTEMEMTNVSFTVGETSNFFDEPQPAELNEIQITNIGYESNNVEDTNILVLTQTIPGQYEGSKNTSFFTDGNELQLRIDHNGVIYSATTNYVPTSPISRLEQGEGSLFTGDETEILISFTDSPGRDDYYLFDFDFNEYLVSEDEFYQGQPFEFSYFYDDGVQPGMEVQISLIGVDEPFFNYMNQVIVQSGGDQGPFQTPSATVRGNILNVSDENGTDNFALGYFAVCQTYTQSITLE
ncbi:MAG: hypothetical protein CML05_14530 [Pseudozobellia sp.]|nr:hypothetical protein [Pseudozobellia sp.]|tara:strand:+ start:794 stop:1627 length:834 start_codon:yes stop_codon:yes gene_type:complete